MNDRFRDVWVDLVRCVNAEIDEAEIIRYTREDGAVVWVSSVALGFLLPEGRFHYLEVLGRTEDGGFCRDEFIDGQECPCELADLIPALIEAGRDLPR